MNKIKKLMTMMAAAGMGIGAAVAGDASSIVVDGSTTVGPVAKAFAEYYMGKHSGVNISVSESGSGNGAKSLINAACDVATMSRPMKNSEKKAAQDAGVLAIEQVVALDGLAVIVNPANSRANLTIEQIRDIYTGKITNWKELGGADQKIVVISRDTNSGTYESFNTLVLKDAKLKGGAEYVGSGGAVRQRVISTEAAIGYVGLAFTERVKVLQVNGIAPTPETVLAKTYPIARPLYMYTNGRPKEGTALYDFVNLCKTEEGKKIIEDTGYVPLK
ncbi:MAG: phosphate ABC transporter substrate-binding protein [bacterium]